jgi:hypothetical protein
MRGFRERDRRGDAEPASEVFAAEAIAQEYGRALSAAVRSRLADIRIAFLAGHLTLAEMESAILLAWRGIGLTWGAP